MIKEKINFKIFLPIFYGIFLLILLIPFYQDEKLISRGEGAYILDFFLLFKNYFSSWCERFGVGISCVNINFGIVPHLLLTEKAFKNQQFTNFFNIYFIYFLPFLIIYLLSLELGLSYFLSFLIAFFYFLNPFIINFLKSINQWNMLAAYILPAFLWLILKFYNNHWKLFFFFGLHSLFFAFTNANPPIMVLYQIALFIFVIFACLYKEKNITFFKIFKKYFLVFSSFILFNFWWIINWFYVIPDAKKSYTKEFAISWLRGREIFVPAFWRALNFQNLLNYPPNPDYDFLNYYFNKKFILIFISFPVFLIFYYLFKKIKKPHFFYFLLFCWIIVGFLSKGVRGIFGRIYEFMVYNLPFFHIFKSAEEKWGLLFVFLTTLLVMIILGEIKKEKAFRFFSIFLLISVCFFLYPFLTGNFLPDYKYNNIVIGSKKFLDKKEYKELRDKLNNDLEQYRVLSLPGSWNYQVALQIEGNRFYTGNDPVLSNTNKPFLAPYNGSWTQRFGVLYDEISHPNWAEILGLYNLKKIVINKDMYPWFGFREKESIAELEEIFDNKFLGEKNEAIDFYDVGDNFLPRFYVPNQIIYSPQSTQYELPELVSLKNISRRPAFFISPYEKIGEKEENGLGNNLIKEKSNQIIIVGEIQSAIDEAKLRAGIRGMNPGGVLFPYARWKPGNLLYPYILKKEEKIKEQYTNEPEKLLEKNLFFAGKRIFEIQKWSRKLKEEEFMAVLEKFEEEMDGALENLEKIKLTGRDTFLLFAKIEVSFEAFSQRLLDVIRSDFGKEHPRFITATKVIQRIDQKIKEVLEHYSQIRYYFDIPEEGEYEVLLEKREGVGDFKIENITSNEEEKFVLEVSPEQEEQSWLSFGQKNFKNSEYVLTLNQSSVENLLSEKWQSGTSEVEIGEKRRLVSQKDMPTNVWQEIENWEEETAYRFSLKYRVNSGYLKIFLVEEKEKVDSFWFDRGVENKLPSKTRIVLEDKLERKESTEWKDYKIVVYSGKDAKKAKLFISAEIKEEGIADVEFKDVVLTKIFEPKMVLRKNKIEGYSSVPQITFQKINPTKYILQVKGAKNPYFLVFSEGFHRGWKAYISKSQTSNLKTQSEKGEIIASYFDGEIKEAKQMDDWFDKKFFKTWQKKALPEERHFLLNGYANGWYIEPQDSEYQEDYEIIVEYWGQRLFYKGIFVTLATIVGGLFVLTIKNVKKNQKYNFSP